MLEYTDSMKEASDFITGHRADIGNKDGWVFISHRGVARGVDINGVEAATMVINFRFANASELEQALGRGNRSPLLNLPAPSHIFVDSDVQANLFDLKRADIARLNNQALNRLANELNGIVSVTLPTKEGIAAAKRSFGHNQQFAEATAIVAELFGNNNFQSFQYANWVLLETVATMEHEILANGNAKEVFD